MSDDTTEAVTPTDPDPARTDAAVADPTQHAVPFAATPEAVQASERRFRKLVQHSSDITLVVDSNAVITWVSPAIEHVLGYDPEQLTGTSTADLAHPDDLGDTLDRLDELLRGEPAATSVTARVRHADGTWRYVSILGTDLSADPDVGGVMLNVRDITARVLAQRASDRLGTVVEATSDLVVIFDRDGPNYLNAAAREFVGMAPDEPPQSLHIDSALPSWVQHTWTSEVLPALSSKGLWSGELAATDLQGLSVPLSVVVVAHKADDGHMEVVSAVARDITERKAFETQLEHQATHDPLTGLPNRTLLLDRLQVALGRAARSHRLAAVIFLDLDHFKVVNDSLGHSHGDQLLVLIAERLSAALRPGDTVARFGGDEFVVLCEDLKSRDEAMVIADRVAASINTPATLDDTEVFISASIGIAVAEGPGTAADDLVRDADAAMYQAKERGRSRTEVFDIKLRRRAVDRLELENSLRRAIDRHELRALYQPTVSVATGRIVGFEALLRWEHPERGLLRPDDFLSIAEETRLIIPIGAWMVRQACRVLARAQHSIPGGDRLSVSINLSARQLMHPDLAGDIGDIIADTAVDPSTVDVEITESVLMEDVESSQVTLARLKALGVRIAVDDFGTGYSSLAYLRRFPVDLLKVDRTFVDGLGTDPSDSAIAAAVVNLAHTLGMLAIAEGVETNVQLEELRALGCDVAQGYLISRPLPDADLLELLSERPTYW